MLSVAEQQEALRAILRGRPVETQGDPWLSDVAKSKGLGILRDTIAWWQKFQIEMQCRYTSRLLKRKQIFAECLAACFQQCTAAPSIEELGTQFLTWLAGHEDGLVRAMAAFELACLNPQSRNATIEWDRDPSRVLLALDQFTGLPPAEPGARYVMRIGADQPGDMTCVRLFPAV
jgi:hypothetical protein